MLKAELTEKKRSSCPLVDSPNVLKDLAQVLLVSHVGAGTKRLGHPLLPCQAHEQDAALEVKHPGSGGVSTS